MKVKEKRPVVSRIGIARIFTIFFVCCFFSLNSFGANISVWPHEIKFNFDGSSNSNDAITIRNASGGTATVPEWAYNNGNPVAEKFAYIMGQSNRSIQVRFNSNCTDMHLIINLTVTSGTGIGTVCNYFVDNYTALDWITLALSGNIPGSVGTRNFTWQWSVYAIPNDVAYCSATSTFNTSHSYYTLLSAPQAPMAEPWKNVLEYACSWASGETDALGVVSKITTGAYNNLGLEYDGGQSHAYYPNFNLTQTLNDGFADCRDMSAIVQVFSNAIGCSNIRVKTIDYDSGSFNYKIIKPIGLPWTTTIKFWNFHQFAYMGNVFDACLQLVESNPRIPINEDVNGSYKNDLFHSGDWNVESEKVYQYLK